jgi:hypothetical protein
MNEILENSKSRFGRAIIGRAINTIKENSRLSSKKIRGEVNFSPEKETQTERYELHGTKIEIEYPGTPVDIYLADKHLQIIDVRGDNRFRGDYLLIDPATFESSNQQTGFKAIRENEPFIVGRSNQLRFELPDTISSEHLKIDLNDFNLVIEDLDSTNGTVVQFDKPKFPSKEEIAAFESSPEKEQALTDFRNYIKRHHNEIEKALKDGLKLDDIFYRNFYNTNIDNPKYKANDPQVQRLINEYPDQIDSTKAILHFESQKNGGLKIWTDQYGYWLYCNINGGYRINKSTDYGRFYFNLRPEYVGRVFTATAKAFRNAGLHSQMKILLNGSLRGFNRFDKMVIYFTAEEEEKILKVIENIYQSHEEAFDDSGIPRFTAAVRDQRGRKMVGIGFGEEPAFTNYSHHSFGSIRSRILADVYMDAKQSRWSIKEPNPDFDLSFYKACLRYYVDPQNPTFNLQGSTEKFSELRRRMKLNS